MGSLDWCVQDRPWLFLLTGRVTNMLLELSDIEGIVFVLNGKLEVMLKMGDFSLVVVLKVIKDIFQPYESVHGVV